MRTNNEIIDYMNELLNRRGMSRNQLAEKVGAASSTVSRYFSKTRQFPLNSANEYAKALGTTPEDLLGVIPMDESKDDPNSHTYTFLPAHIAAGALTSVDPITYEDAEYIQLSDAIMGKYAGDRDIAVMYADGESMNRVIPNGSLMAIKITDSDLKNGDIVVFCDNGDYSVKRYYDNSSAKIVTFTPDSTNNKFEPIVYRYEDMDNVRIIGRVVVYAVVL